LLVGGGWSDDLFVVAFFRIALTINKRGDHLGYARLSFRGKTTKKSKVNKETNIANPLGFY